MIIYNPDLKIFTSSLINDRHFISGFSTSELGNSLDLGVIERFFSRPELRAKKSVILQQIHSVNIEDLDQQILENSIQTIPETDGMVGTQPNYALVVRTADCVPLIIVDKTKGVIGASHQGWRGSLKNMTEKMVQTFISKGSNTENLVCAIGPAIGACCYDVDDDHYHDFLAEYEKFAEQIFFHRKGRWHISLSRLNYLQLIAAGVKKEKIDFFPFCTKCDSERFFSRRRSKTSDFGEMFNFVLKY